MSGSTGRRPRSKHRPRRAPALRSQQHPVRHEHPHRRVGARQERPVRVAAARRRPDPLGLRVGGTPSPAVRTLAPAGELPRRRRADAGGMPVETGIPDRLAERIAHEFGSAISPASRSASTWPTSSPSRRCSARACTSPTARASSSRRARSRPRRRSHSRPVGRARRRRLRGDLPHAPAGRLRARDRRARPPVALRAGLGARRSGERGLGRPVQPASARLLRPAAAPGGPGLLRHHPLVHGLSHVLLPHVQRRRCQPRADRRVQALPGMARRRDRACPARA